MAHDEATEVRTTTTIGINGAGLTGTLRLTWVRDDLAHVIDHADTDEPTGTWTGLACLGHELPIGSDVGLDVLRNLCTGGEVADLIWEAPDDLASEHNHVHQAALQAYQNEYTQLAEQEWRKVEAVWSRAWAANCAAIEFLQGAGLTKFSPVKPQRWVVASFEHHCGPHGAQSPHVHNIVIANLTCSLDVQGSERRRGISRLMVEDGSEIHTHFRTSGPVDEMHLAIAPFPGDPIAPSSVNPGSFP